MDMTMNENGCQICLDFSIPYSVGYIEESPYVCKCGNHKHLRNQPAINIGNLESFHLLIIPSPGCTVCGFPANVAMTFYYQCKSKEELKEQMREIYHNDGLRN